MLVTLRVAGFQWFNSIAKRFVSLVTFSFTNNYHHYLTLVLLLVCRYSTNY